MKPARLSPVLPDRPTAAGQDPRAVALFALVAGIGGLVLSRAVLRTRYSFRDRAVLLMGGSRGLGLGMARQLVAEGARVWLLARSKDELDRAAGELRSRGGRVWTITADVTDPEATEAAVREVVSVAGTIDVLINVAGIITVAPFEHTPIEDVAASLATHFWGPLYSIRAALPHMRRGGEGRIVNISSIGGRVAVPHLSAYAAGKFALTGFSETLHAELKKDGIIVTTVTPGLMRTGSYVNAAVRGRHEQEAQWFSAMTATPLTSKNAARAARQILDACRRGDPTCTPGWQARVAHIASAVTPNLMGSMMALMNEYVLPQPTGASSEPRPVRDLNLGWVRPLLPERARRIYHQP